MTPHPTHPFDEAIALEPAADGRLRGSTSEHYWNFVGPFGGVTAAIALNAVLRDAARLGDPLALTVNYAGPIQAGDFLVDARALRTNRGTQHWHVAIAQRDAEGREETVVNAVAVFAVRRPTFSMTEAPPPVVPPAASLERSRRPGLPRWVDRYDMRFVRGRPLEPNEDSHSQVWLSDDPPRPLDFASLASLADAFFPRVFTVRPKVVPIATVSLNTYFHVDAGELAALGAVPVLGVARGNVFDKGFFDQHGELWSEAGRLLATTHQIVWFKD